LVYSAEVMKIPMYLKIEQCGSSTETIKHFVFDEKLSLNVSKMETMQYADVSYL